MDSGRAVGTPLGAVEEVVRIVRQIEGRCHRRLDHAEPWLLPGVPDEIRIGRLEAHRVTGEDRIIVRIVVEEMAQLELAIDALTRFGAVTPSVVLASYPPKTIRGSRLDRLPR